MTLRLDHLLVAGPDLPSARAHVTHPLGRAPVDGGRHAGFGTHNALLGLRGGAYLEAVAPDPSQPDGGPFARALAGLDAPALVAWCVATDAPDALAARLDALGTPATTVAMGRTTPGGERLAWTLTFAAPDGETAAPFFIHWGDTPHPTTHLPAAATLARLDVTTPRAGRLRPWLRDLGLDDPRVTVRDGPTRTLRASLDGAAGPAILAGPARAMGAASGDPPQAP